MKKYKADLHIHSLLSPCGSLEMSPRNIIEASKKQGLDIIAITDHNSTKQAPLVQQIGKENNIWVICGAEVNSKEEVHCLTLFENLHQLNTFQNYIDKHLQKIENNPDLFGEQIVVDKDEMIVDEEKWLLINALTANIHQIEKKVHQLGGIFIPAHIDRPYNGILSQLGIIPPDLSIDALEISKNACVNDWTKSDKIPGNINLIQSSDAHMPGQIGSGFSVFFIETPTFTELRMALHNKNNRSIMYT